MDPHKAVLGPWRISWHAGVLSPSSRSWFSGECIFISACFECCVKFAVERIAVKNVNQSGIVIGLPNSPDRNVEGVSIIQHFKVNAFGSAISEEDEVRRIVERVGQGTTCLHSLMSNGSQIQSYHHSDRRRQSRVTARKAPHETRRM